MIETCKHSNCAVCKQIEDRVVFESILKTVHPEVYICEHASYRITDPSGFQIILPSLERLEKGRYGYYILDTFTSDRIYINKDNFEVLCFKSEECNITPYVAEYNIKQQKKTAK